MAWRRGDKLGFGRFGIVFDCHPSDDNEIAREGQEYAIKYLQTDLAPIDEAVERFVRESEILKALEHPNVMTVVDTGRKADGVPWFVMPRANGGDLRDAIEQGRVSAEAVAVGIMRDVLAGVAHAHENGVLHRDLKPSNILLHDSRPRISDFGIARNMDVDGTRLTLTEQELGTFRYMAPEQAEDAKRAGPPADVYALGKIFGHLLTGRRPEPMTMDVSDVPEKFRWFVDKCTRKNADDRFSDASAALRRFEELMERPDVELPPVDEAERLIEDAFKGLGTSHESGILDALDAHLQRYSDQRGLFHAAIPTVPAAVWERWSTSQPASFVRTIETYAGHLDNGLDFDYCDTAASFLIDVYALTDDLTVRRLVLSRLLSIGRSHNRWYVRDTTVDLLASMASQSEINCAEEVIDGQQADAAWIAPLALARPMRAPIHDALRRAMESRDAVGF